MSKVTPQRADLIEISTYLDQMAARLNEADEAGYVAAGPLERSGLSARLQRYAGTLLRWDR